jgi:hypothetical protein
MGFTTFAHDKILNAYGQAASLASPATHFVGLMTATTWVASHAYSSGAYVIPTTFGSISGQVGKIFKCTTAGTSGTGQPTWPTTAGGTVTDGTVTWTEVSLLFQSGTFTGAEISGNNYSRVSVTANSTNFPNASNAQPAVIQNGTVFTFPTPSADWGFAAAWLLADASSAGNVWVWGAMTSALDCSSGSTPSFGVNALQIQMTP